MDPVNVILELKFSRRLCVKMKKEAMDEVLDQGEEQHAGKNNHQNRRNEMDVS